MNKPHAANGKQWGMAFDNRNISPNTNNVNPRLLEQEKLLVLKKMLLGKDFVWPYAFFDNRTRVLYNYAGYFREDNQPCLENFIVYLREAHFDNTTVLEAGGGEVFVRSIFKDSGGMQ